MRNIVATLVVTSALATTAIAADTLSRDDTPASPAAAAVAAAAPARRELAAVERMSPLAKANLLVVSGLPAPPGVGGVIVQRWNLDSPRPRGAITFVDQEGGEVRAFRTLPPERAPSSFATVREAFGQGLATGRALDRKGIDVDLAPVVDLADGPLGSRHFRSPALAVAFARGLARGRTAACAKHFPGLGSAAESTDDRSDVAARVRPKELAAFRAAVRAGVPCVMTSHAFYPRTLGPRRASITPKTYRLLRSPGFRGIAITDSLSFLRAAPVERWAPQAARAGADLLLFNHPEHAERAIRALLPLARSGELDVHVERVLRFRAQYGH